MRSNLAEMASLLMQMRTLMQELKDILAGAPNTDIDNVLRMIDASHIRQNDFYDSIVKLDTAVRGLQANGANNTPLAQAKLTQLQNIMKQACSLFMRHTAPNVNPAAQNNGAAQANSASTTIRSILIKLASNLTIVQLSPAEITQIQGMVVIAQNSSDPTMAAELGRLHSQGIVGPRVRQHLVDKLKFYDGPVAIKDYEDIQIYSESFGKSQAAVNEITQILGANPAPLNLGGRLHFMVQTELTNGSGTWTNSLKTDVQSFLGGQPASPEVKTFLQNVMKPKIEDMVNNSKAFLERLKTDFLANAMPPPEAPGQTVRGLLLRLNGISPMVLSRTELFFINGAYLNSSDVEQAKALEKFLQTGVVTEAVRAYLELAILLNEGTNRYMVYRDIVATQAKTNMDRTVVAQLTTLHAAGAKTGIVVPVELRNYLEGMKNNPFGVFNTNLGLLAELDALLQLPSGSGSLTNTGNLFAWLQTEAQTITQRITQSDANIAQAKIVFVAPLNPPPQTMHFAPTTKILKQLISAMLGTDWKRGIPTNTPDINWFILNEISKSDGNPALQAELRQLLETGVVTVSLWTHFTNMLMSLGTTQEQNDYMALTNAEIAISNELKIQSQLQALMNSAGANPTPLPPELRQRLDQLVQANSTAVNNQWSAQLSQEMTALLQTQPVLTAPSTLLTYLGTQLQNLDTNNKAERTRIDNLHQQFNL